MVAPAAAPAGLRKTFIEVAFKAPERCCSSSPAPSWRARCAAATDSHTTAAQEQQLLVGDAARHARIAASKPGWATSATLSSSGLMAPGTSPTHAFGFRASSMMTPSPLCCQVMGLTGVMCPAKPSGTCWHDLVVISKIPSLAVVWRDAAGCKHRPANRKLASNLPHQRASQDTPAALFTVYLAYTIN